MALGCMGVTIGGSKLFVQRTLHARNSLGLSYCSYNCFSLRDTRHTSDKKSSKKVNLSACVFSPAIVSNTLPSNTAETHLRQTPSKCLSERYDII